MITWDYASAADVDLLYSGRPYETLRAIVIRVDGQPAGIIGLAKEPERDRLFSEYTEALQPHLKSMAILRALKVMMAWVHASRVPVYAIAENAKLLERLGFEQLDGEVYTWPS